MLKAENISGGYGKKTVVKGISFQADDGKVYAVIGPNGCGKSTFLQLLCGLLRPDSGTLFIDDKNIAEYSRTELARRISYLSQLHQSGSISVRSLVSHGRFPYLGYPRRYTSEDKAEVFAAMELAGVSGIADKNISELSGGERQRAYIAMLLAQNTQTVLLDEPATYLDIKHRLEISELVLKMKKLGKSVIMVSHDINEALCTADFVMVMNNGKVESLDTPQKIYESGIIDKVFGVRMSFSENEKQYFSERIQK